MSIKGAVLAHTYYGSPDRSIVPAAQQHGTRLSNSSAEYVGRGNKCCANEDTCEGNRVKGQDLCAGHLRSVRKAELSAQTEGAE